MFRLLFRGLVDSDGTCWRFAQGSNRAGWRLTRVLAPISKEEPQSFHYGWPFPAGSVNTNVLP